MDGISVVIPTLNRTEIVLNTISAVLSQKFDKPWEVIVVDQSDLLDFKLIDIKDNRYHYYHVTQFKGLPEARNFGVQHALYDYILFLDDDIECENNLLTEHYKYIIKPEIGVVAGGITEKFKLNPSCKITGYFHNITAVPERGFDKKQRLFVDHAGGGNYSIKKAIFKQIGGVDEYLNYGAALYEETDLCLRVKKIGYKVFFNYDAHVWHLAVPSGGCRVNDLSKYIRSLVHNRALIISRHLKWYYQVTATLYLLRLVLAYAIKNNDFSLFLLFVSNYKKGYKKGKLQPKYTNYRL